MVERICPGLKGAGEVLGRKCAGRPVRINGAPGAPWCPLRARRGASGQTGGLGRRALAREILARPG
jgi:hypothetical protein